ncbi:chitinase [Kitasatospora sp. NPDC091207]|uniref:chitinase n=1 Tax=Kitasatospora sp. NPDC091207 TaxID=3364083 RepID=UPI00381CE9C9
MPKHRLTRRRRMAAASTALVAGAALILMQYEAPAAVTADTADPIGLNAVSEYLGWGDAPDPVAVMKATGLRQFALSFVLSGGGCDPKWDGSRALTGGGDEKAIKKIRAAGGEVLASFGGWDGAKLGERCATAAELAAAYQKVVDAYGLKAVDIDIESTELSTPEVRKRVVDALKALKAKNPGLLVYVTFPVDPTGPDADGADLITLAAKAGLVVDGWTAMPFDFTTHDGTMAAATVTAVTGLQRAVAAAYDWDDDKAWRHTGVSSMNGRTDQQGEQLTPADFRAVRDFAATRHLARFGFWAVNRDRPCAGGTFTTATCSGVQQAAYDFTRIVAGYHADSVPGGGAPCPSPSVVTTLPTGPGRTTWPLPTPTTARPADAAPSAGEPKPSLPGIASGTPTPARTACVPPSSPPATVPPTAPTTAPPTSTTPSAPASAGATTVSKPPTTPAGAGTTTTAPPTPGAVDSPPTQAAGGAPAPAAPGGGSLASTGAGGTDILLTTTGALLFLGGALGLVGTRRRDPEQLAG